MKINNIIRVCSSPPILKNVNKKDTSFQGDYHVKPHCDVELKGDMYYILLPKLPPIALGKTAPAWLEKIDLINDILDETENPEQVKERMDSLMETAKEGNKSTVQQIATDKVKEIVDRIENKDELSALFQIFNLEHKYEVKSSEHGGSMSSSLCTQMKMYAVIKSALAEKLEITE